MIPWRRALIKPAILTNNYGGKGYVVGYYYSFIVTNLIRSFNRSDDIS